MSLEPRPASLPLIERIVVSSIRGRGWVIGFVLLLIIAGAYAASRLELDALPDITGNQVIVLTQAPGLTPEEVERSVTRPIEAALGGLSGLVEQRSLSRYGISSVTAVFDDGVDPWLARQQVAERLTGLEAFRDSVASPQVAPFTGGLGEVVQFTVSSREHSLAQIYELVQVQVAPLLRATPGVVEVNVWGGERRTFDVVADPVAMASYGLDLGGLADTLRDSTGAVPGASLSAGPGQSLLRGVHWPQAPSDLGALVLLPPTDAVDPNGSPLRLADVATLSTGGLPRIGAATRNGSGETVYVMVQMLRGANALEVTERFAEQLPTLRASLPPGASLELVYDRSKLVNATLRTLATNLGEGAALVSIVLLLLLGSVRAGLLVATVIPLSMLGAVIGMVSFDVPGNLMSLGAIDFGLIVDGAVVMVERSFHDLAALRNRTTDPQGPSKDSVRATLMSAMRRVARPMLFSVVIIALVYVPILALQGVDGKMFRPMALTVVFALGCSLVLALTFVPAATSWLDIRFVPRREPMLVRAMTRVYAPMLRAVMGAPGLVMIAAVAVLGAGGLAAARSGSSFVPQLDEGDLVIQTTRAADISLETAVQEASRLETVVLEAIPEAQSVSSRIGSPEVATDIMGLEQADVFVTLAPREQWREGLTREALIDEIDAAIALHAPGGDPAFTQPIQMRFNELVGGAVTDVSVELYGEDVEQSRKVAESIVRAVSIVPGATDVRLLAPPAVSLLEVRPKLIEASQLGFSNAEVLMLAQMLRVGVEVGATWDGPVRIPIRLLIAHDVDAFSLPNLLVASPRGDVVALSQIADISLRTTPSLVNRHQAQRRVVVGFNVRGDDLGSVVVAARQAVEDAVPIPRGTTVRWGGQFAQLEEARGRLALVIPVVLLGILVLLMVAFGAVRPALLIFTNVPFAGVGGVLALWGRAMPISISAAVGFVALSGIAVLNGVVLMSRVLERQRAGASAVDAARGAATERMRPVMMTALVAALGFVPMALATGVGAEIQRPLATVVVGGLLTSTLLTLLILPALYPWFAKRVSHSAKP